jgi:hypothetical protein
VEELEYPDDHCRDPLHLFAKEKMVVFGCKRCLEELNTFNPHTNEQGEGIALENIVAIEITENLCENTTFELEPILLNKSEYSDLSGLVKVTLLNRAIPLAIQNGYSIKVMVWKDAFAYDEGFPFEVTWEDHFQSYLEEDAEYFTENPGEAVVGVIDGYREKYGCTELIAEKDDDVIVLYHEERDDEYLPQDLFNLLDAYRDKKLELNDD